MRKAFLVWTALFLFISARPSIAAQLPAPPQGWEAIPEEEVPAGTSPTGTQEDQRCGFIAYVRDYMTPMAGSARPAREEINAPLAITLARNESEPLLVGVFGLRKLDDVEVVIQPPAMSQPEAGGVKCEIRRLVERAVAADSGAGGVRRFRWVPSLLEPSNRIDIHPHRSTGIWVTVKAAVDTPDGEYRRTLVFLHRGKVIRTLPMHVRVLPLTLVDVPDRSFATLYTPLHPKLVVEGNSRRLLEDLRDHGMNVLSPVLWGDGPPLDLTRDGDRIVGNLVRHLQQAVAVGLNRPVILNLQRVLRTGRPGLDINYTLYDNRFDRAAMAALVRRIEAARRQFSLPEIIYLPIDEPGCFTDQAGTRRNDIAVTLLQDLNLLGVPGATTVADLVDDQHRRLPRWRHVVGQWERMRPYCAVRIYANGYPQGETSLARETEDARVRGHRVMLYENQATMGIDPGISRLYFGYYGRWTGADGVTAWTHPTLGWLTVRHAWQPASFGSTYRDYFTDPNWRLDTSTVCWEMVREGIEDARYLYLLESRSSWNPSDTGRLLVNQIMRKTADAGMMSKHPRCDWTGATFWRLRQRIIAALMADAGVPQPVLP